MKLIQSLALLISLSLFSLNAEVQEKHAPAKCVQLDDEIPTELITLPAEVAREIDAQLPPKPNISQQATILNLKILTLGCQKKIISPTDINDAQELINIPLQLLPFLNTNELNKRFAQLTTALAGKKHLFQGSPTQIIKNFKDEFSALSVTPTAQKLVTEYATQLSPVFSLGLKFARKAIENDLHVRRDLKIRPFTQTEEKNDEVEKTLMSFVNAQPYEIFMKFFGTLEAIYPDHLSQVSWFKDRIQELSAKITAWLIDQLFSAHELQQILSFDKSLTGKRIQSLIEKFFKLIDDDDVLHELSSFQRQLTTAAYLRSIKRADLEQAAREKEKILLKSMLQKKR